MFSELSSKILGYAPWSWVLASREELTCVVLCDRVVGLELGED